MGPWQGVGTHRTLPTHGCSLWKGILSSVDIIRKHTNFVIGNGSRIRFWSDSWCTETPLATQFPKLFELSASQTGTVKAHWTEASKTWNLHFWRPLHDWEIAGLALLLQTLANSPVTDDEDCKAWQDGHVPFAPKFVYQQLERDIMSK